MSLRSLSSVLLMFCFMLILSSALYGQTDEEAKNAAVMKRLYNEAVNQGNIDLIDELAADDFIEHEPLADMPANREGVKKFFTMMRKAFPDLKFTVNDMAAKGDKVWTYITISGTQEGPFLDIPASGKKVNVEGFDLVRFVNGKAVEHWGLTNDMVMMTQLGAIPAHPEEKKK